jgi:hypothetical protein
MQVVAHAFRLDVSGAQANWRLMEQAALLAEAVPFLRLTLPDDLNSLVATCRQVIQLLHEHVFAETFQRCQP